MEDCHLLIFLRVILVSVLFWEHRTAIVTVIFRGDFEDHFVASVSAEKAKDSENRNQTLEATGSMSSTEILI